MTSMHDQGEHPDAADPGAVVGLLARMIGVGASEVVVFTAPVIE